MEETVKKNSNSEESNKKKERHIVAWTPQEDCILREQISLHGTESWTTIASNFKDKSTRQCRRRWYTYLNSDFKKGGWSQEEDMLLCEAQKIYGNRWTEIAKVVSGRTDNAVKNRFSTLCKKRAKFEALTREDEASFINEDNKRVIVQNAETAEPSKRIRRAHIYDHSENSSSTDRSHKKIGTALNHQPRPPLAALNINNMVAHHPPSITKDFSLDAAKVTKIQGTFLKKDDPKITALMQQAELLSSLALRVKEENTDQSLENAWKDLQDFLNQSKENNMITCGDTEFDFQLEDFKDMLEDLRISNEGFRSSPRQLGLFEESPAGSEYSTGSTLIPHKECDNTGQSQSQVAATSQLIPLEEQIGLNEYQKQIFPQGNINQVEIFPDCEFSSPLQVNPLFRSLAAGIPSPQFSESERNFLLKALGIESPVANANINPAQSPPCKRSLLQSL